jgi:hypothetical protein
MKNCYVYIEKCKWAEGHVVCDRASEKRKIKGLMHAKYNKISKKIDALKNEQGTQKVSQHSLHNTLYKRVENLSKT